MNAHDGKQLLRTLQARFAQHMHRHAGIAWAEVRSRIEGNPAALASLRAMEASGGEPDLIGRDERTGRFIDCDGRVFISHSGAESYYAARGFRGSLRV